jgi:hypothetical protein
MAKTQTTKLDLYKVHRSEYLAPKEPTLVDVGPATYLSFEGRGEPGGAAFNEAFAALYPVAYTIKFLKKAEGQDFKVTGLEGQWWADGREFTSTPPADWNWRLLVRVPDFVTLKDLDNAVEQLEKKGKVGAFRQVRLIELDEGRCVQVLHVGPYATEQVTISKMHEFIDREGLRLAGYHHELYLSDPRRVPEERLKTIVRQPVAAA